MKRILPIFFLILGLFSCNKEDDLGESGLLPSNVEQNELDKYIYENFTKDYNIKIQYKWSPNEVEMGKELLPIQLDRVKPFCELLKTLWLEPYLIHGGKEFVQTVFPKQIVLVGSLNVDASGSGDTKGVTEGGKKVTLFALNVYDFKDKEQMRNLFLTIHHEFGHVMHQTKNYNESFKTITPDRVANWYLYKEEDAHKKGFVSAYSMESPDEDFCETLGHRITNSDETWKSKIQYLDDKGELIKIEQITKKVNNISDYMREKWSIELEKIRTEFQTRHQKL
ncbi:MAG: putative zinc-binding metallopeptidase [Marinifilaceae bacterium]|jgi:substrate import-associated zinc metallohydrolase lipoprotein|nr:putative zinc-binding metallopeptidase [Marinifilaceae bacterium]